MAVESKFDPKDMAGYQRYQCLDFYINVDYRSFGILVQPVSKSHSFLLVGHGLSRVTMLG